MSYKLCSRRHDSSSFSWLVPGGRVSAYSWHCISYSCGGAWVGAESRDLGDLSQISPDWNHGPVEVEYISCWAMKWDLLHPQISHLGTSLVYNGGNVLIHSSWKAWLYGPMRQTTERDGLIAAWWTAYCLERMSAIKDHLQPVQALIPGVVQSFLVWFAPTLSIHLLKTWSLQLSQTSVSGLK